METYEQRSLSDKTVVLGPTSLSSRRRATVVLAALGDPSVVGSEIWGKICRDMGMTREWASMEAEEEAKG